MGAGGAVVATEHAGGWDTAPRPLPGELIWAVPRDGGIIACIGGDPDRVAVFARGWTMTSASPTMGKDACHLALSPDGRLAAVADYGAGTVSVHRIGTDDVQVVRHEGRGADVKRQAGPHAHWVGFSRDGRWLHAVDLGADAIFAHRIDRGRVVDTRIAWRAPPGTGPRHMAHHPRARIAYVVGELGNTLDTLRDDGDGRFTSLHRQSTLPAGHAARSYAAHLAIDPATAMLYVSNRGADTIAAFSLADPARPVPVQQAAIGGSWPRFFLIQRRRLIVANERSAGMTILPIDPRGMLGAPRSGPMVAKAKFALSL